MSSCDQSESSIFLTRQRERTEKSITAKFCDCYCHRRFVGVVTIIVILLVFPTFLIVNRKYCGFAHLPYHPCDPLYPPSLLRYCYQHITNIHHHHLSPHHHLHRHHYHHHNNVIARKVSFDTTSTWSRFSEFWYVTSDASTRWARPEKGLSVDKIYF